MKIIIIDVDSQQAHIVSNNSCQSFTFDNLQDFCDYISGEQVLYVTDMQQVSGEDIIPLLSSLSNQAIQHRQFSDQKFIRSTVNSYMILKSNTEGEEGLVFSNKYDCKPYHPSIIEKYSLVDKFLSDGTLQIVSDAERHALNKQKFKEEQERFQKLRQLEDQSSHKEGSLRKRLESGDLYADDDLIDNAVSIDLSDTKNAFSSKEEQEFYITAKSAGIDLDGEDK